MSDWLSQPIGEHHDLTTFASGNGSLDRWLQRDALRAHRAGISRTTVWSAHGEHAVMTYHAIAPTQIRGYLIGRLALDRALHGQGLDTQLLLDLERIVDAAERAGGRVIVVDAIDDAAHRFHRHHGFHGIEHHNRLVIMLATAAALLHDQARPQRSRPPAMAGHGRGPRRP